MLVCINNIGSSISGTLPVRFDSIVSVDYVSQGMRLLPVLIDFEILSILAAIHAQIGRYHEIRVDWYVPVP